MPDDMNPPNQAANREPAEGARQDDTNQKSSVTHDRQSHIINPGAEENARRDDADIDPVMPTGDSSLNTKI
jgi:hypothetical protein